MSFGIWRAARACVVGAAALPAVAAISSSAIACSAGTYEVGIARAGAGFLIVWQDDSRDGDDIAAHMVAANGRPLGSTFLVNRTRKARQTGPAVTTLTDGGLVAVWCSDHELKRGAIYGQRLKADGTKVGPEFRIDDSGREEIDPAIAPLADGGFVVVWTASGRGGSDIYGQRFTSDGDRLGAPIEVATSTQPESSPAVAPLRHGGFVAIWSGGSQIRGQRYDANGEKIGGALVIESSPGNNAYGSNAKVAMLRNGSFVVVWRETFFCQEYGCMRAQQFSTAGVALRETFPIARQSQNLRDVAALSGGGFIVAWAQKSKYVYGRSFAADGTADGDPFRISTHESRAYSDPPIAVVGLKQNKFAATWLAHSTVFYNLFAPAP